MQHDKREQKNVISCKTFRSIKNLKFFAEKIVAQISAAAVPKPPVIVRPTCHLRRRTWPHRRESHRNGGHEWTKDAVEKHPAASFRANSWVHTCRVTHRTRSGPLRSVRADTDISYDACEGMAKWCREGKVDWKTQIWPKWTQKVLGNICEDVDARRVFTKNISGRARTSSDTW